MLTRLKSAFASLFASTSQTAPGTGGDPFGWVLSGTSRTPLLRGRLEILQGYGTMPWLRAVTHRVATATAAVERTLSVRTTRGGLRPLTSHPLLDLLRTANPLLGAQASLQLTQLSLDLVGEAFWLLERNALGMPLAYWPLSPAWVTQLPTLGLPFFRLSAGALQQQVPVTEMVWFKDIDPLNPYGHGHGLGQVLSDELETDEYAAKHTKAWFYNSARPDIIVTADGLTKDDTKRLEEDWNRRNKGFWNAFKTYFLNKKVDVTALSHTFADMELIKLRQYERDIIIQIFGVPPEIMGIVEHSNRATIIESNTLFSTYVMIPRLALQTDTLQRVLVPQFDARLLLGYVSPVPEDREYKLNVMKAAPQAFLVDQWQAAAGEPPLPGGAGQVFYTPTTQTVHNNLDAPDQGTPAVEPVAPPKQWGVNSGEVVSKDRKEVVRKEVMRKAGDPSDSPLTTNNQPLTTTLKAAFLALLADLSAATTLEDLEAALRTGNAQVALDAIPWGQFMEQGSRLTDLLTDALDQAGGQEAAALSALLGVSVVWDGAHVQARAAAQQLTEGLLEDLLATSQTAMRTLIEQGLAAGTSTPELAGQIRTSLGLTMQQAQAVERFRAELTAQGVDAAAVERRVTRYAEAQRGLRADIVAQTETPRALHAGTLAAWRQAVAAGQLTADEWRKVWEVLPDERLCTRICEPVPEKPENADLGIEDRFTLGDGSQVLTPPGHPLCRCAMQIERKV